PLTNAVNGSRELNDSESLRIGVITEQVDTSEYSRLSAMSRSYRVGLAWWRLDRFVMFARAAQAELADAARLSGDPSYRDGIRRARDIWLQQAISGVAQVNRRLAYADPNPSSYPKIIGPHGDYDRTQWFLWRAQWYAHDALDNVRIAYAGE